MGIVIRQSIKGTLVTYIGSFIGFITTIIIIPKFLGQELYGLTRVLLEASTLLATVFQLGTSQSVMRFFPYFKNKEKENNGFFFYMISIITFGFLVFIPIFFLLKTPISNYFSKESALFVDYLYWIIPLAFFLIYWMTFEVYANVLMKIVIPKFIREVVVRVLLIGVYMAYALGYTSLDGFVMNFVIVYGLAMIITFLYISKIGPVGLKHDASFVTPKLKKDYLSYSSIIVLGVLGGTISNKIGLFMISGMEGLAMTGIYSIAFYMVSIVEIPARSITGISVPLASDYLKKKEYGQVNDLYKKVSLNQMLIGTTLLLLIWINIDNIYSIMPDGDSYREGKWVVLFIGISNVIQITLGFGFHLISFSKFYRWNLFFTFFSAGLSVLFNYLLIPRMGISGGALATASSVFIFYIFQQMIVQIKLKSSPYSIGMLKVLATLLIALGLNYILPVIDNAFLDAIYRTAIVGALMLLLIYYSKISKEFNETLEVFISRIKKQK